MVYIYATISLRCSHDAIFCIFVRSPQGAYDSTASHDLRSPYDFVIVGICTIFLKII